MDNEPETIEQAIIEELGELAKTDIPAHVHANGEATAKLIREDVRVKADKLTQRVTL